MRRRRLREAQRLAQGHTDGKVQSQDLSQVCVLLFTLLPSVKGVRGSNSNCPKHMGSSLQCFHTFLLSHRILTLTL